MNHKILYHITSASEWDTAQTRGEYKSLNFAEEGFIHCSYSHQLLTVANRFYRGQNGLVILVIESSTIISSHRLLSGKTTEPTVTVSLIEENLEGGTELYPHLYCLLPINSVIKVVAFPCDADGGFILPEELEV
jgi:uncharacterized protein (DUF952 family)